ncbi:MAG: protein kinase [bacterium]|nr:protein kinase [bacterium]
MLTCSSCGTEVPGAAKFCPSCGTRAVDGDTGGDALVGRTLNDKYRLVERVGAGSMGTVYLAEHIGLNKPVALKILRPDLELTRETLQRFQREGIAAGRITHPNAIQIFDFDHAGDSLFYLAMEFVHGVTLTRFVTEQAPLTFDRALDITNQILSALGAAHSQGIVHRDLKPDNVMVVEDEEGAVAVKVLDFGLSKLVHLPLQASMQTQPGRVMGTPRYMAPEQGTGDAVDARSDLYAVGLILYEMLVGETPFPAESFRELFVKQATQPPPTISVEYPELNLPLGLDELFETVLAKEPDERFQSAEEMSDALIEVGSEPASRAGRRRAPKKRPQAAQKMPRSPRAGSAPPARSWTKIAVPLALAAVGAVLWQVIGGGGANAAPPPRVSMKPAAEQTEEERRYLSLLTDARAALRTGDVDAALAKVEQAHQLPVADSEVFLVRARVFCARRDDDTALVELDEALERDPSYAAAAALVGWIRLDRTEHAQAEASFERAESADGGSSEALAGRGALALIEGDVAEARKQLESAAEASELSAAGYYWLGRARLADGDAQGAVEVLVRAKREDPQAARNYTELARAYLALERVPDAETQLREALRVDPDGSWEAAGELAALQVDSERYGDAEEVLREALRKHPQRGRLRVLQALTLEALDRTNEAIGELERALPHTGDDVNVRILLGTFLQRAGRAADALVQYEAAAKLDEDRYEPHFDSGLALFELERYGEAAAAFEAALLRQEVLLAHFALGVLYKDYLGNPGKARTYFENYVQLGGDDGRVRTWLQELR